MTTLALLDHLTGWWDALTLAKQFYYGVGMLAGVMALILVLLSIIGLEHHDAIDAAGTDVHDGSGLFSVKPLTGFFLGFGWAGGLALSSGLSLFAATACALVAGAALTAVIVMILRVIWSLRSDGTMRIADAVGAIGTVYLTLPAAKAAGGQVVVNFNGRQETFPALNAGTAPVPSGEKVKVLATVDSRTLLVEPLS